ncbi:MAG: MFS transporter [Terriglobales bacterium]
MTAENHRTPLFVSACAGMASFGVALVFLGTMFGIPTMRARLGVADMVRQGSLQAVLVLGVFLVTVIAGPLIDRFGTKPVLAGSAFLLGIAMAALSGAHGYTAATLLALLLGLGGGGLNLATNALVSDVYHDNRGAKLNLLGVFFGVGALAFASLAALLEPRHLPLLMAVIAVGAFALALVYLLLPFPSARETSGFSLAGAASVVRYPGVFLLALMLFFESGNEAALIGWASTWAGSFGAQARAATLVLAGFQLMMIAGRIIASRLLRYIGMQRLVLASAAGALASMIVLVTAHSAAQAALAVALAGLTFSPIYQTVLAIAGDRYRQFAATVFGVLFAVGLSGGMLVPWMIGHLSQSFGIRAGMAAPLVGASMICVLMAREEIKKKAQDTPSA